MTDPIMDERRQAFVFLLGGLVGQADAPETEVLCMYRAAIAAFDAARQADSMNATGTYSCPHCGKDSPHTHDRRREP